MSNIFTLDSLREEADKQFAPVKIGLSDGSLVTLRNLLRLDKKDREAVIEKLKSLEGLQEKEEQTVEDLDAMADAAVSIISLAADDGKKLTKELGGDLGLAMQVLEKWMEETQPGEAESSPA